MKTVRITAKTVDEAVVEGLRKLGATLEEAVVRVIEEPTGGHVFFEGTDITDPKVNINVHRQKMGMVFQQFNLFPNMTIKENIMLAPVKLNKMTREEAEKKAMELLKRIGLSDKADAYPSQLSGGQMQRVAIARALINDPEIVLADEPTGALDSTTSVQVMDLLKDVARDRLVIMVTHNPELAEECQRVLTLRDGLIVGERKGTGERAAF